MKECCDACWDLYDQLHDKMYCELKSLGSDCEDREQIQDEYLAELQTILDECDHEDTRALILTQ